MTHLTDPTRPNTLPASGGVGPARHEVVTWAAARDRVTHVAPSIGNPDPSTLVLLITAGSTCSAVTILTRT